MTRRASSGLVTIGVLVSGGLSLFDLALVLQWLLAALMDGLALHQEHALAEPHDEIAGRIDAIDSAPTSWSAPTMPGSDLSRCLPHLLSTLG